MNHEHVSILLEGRDAWNSWRRENPSVEPNLAGVLIKDKDLRGFDLSRVYLSKAVMKNVNLSGVDLGGVHMPMPIIDRCNFSKAKLDGADMYGAIVTDCDLRNCSLIKANLSETDLQRLDLTEANMSEALLRRCVFEKSIMTRAIMREIKITCSRMSYCNLDNTTLVGASFSSTEVIRCDMSGSDMTNAILSGSVLNFTRLEGAKGVTVLMIDPRYDTAGYQLVTWTNNEARRMYNSGCRCFTSGEAIDHWDGYDYPSKVRGALYVKTILEHEKNNE